MLAVLDHVSKWKAISGVSATIAAGQITGLVGPDGAGKTTLLRLMAGLLVADGGRLTVCDVDPAVAPEKLHVDVSYMPQSFGLYEDLTVADNLSLYADLRGVIGVARVKATERLLAFTGLAPFQGRLAGALSGGMKQKLGLACALIHPPRLLLLDEPSAGVDPLSRRELWRMVEALTADGIGVVWSTAYLDEAERCRSVLLMDQGRLLYSGTPESLTARFTGRTFVVPRAVLAEASRCTGVLDAQIQGGRGRLILAEGSVPPEGLGAVAVAARFEDAFVGLLVVFGEGSAARVPVGLSIPAPVGDGNAPVIEVRDLCRQFGDFRAVDGVSFTVARGEIFGLLGPNGAGKSTTFKMMCGLLPPTSGNAFIDGIDLLRAPAEARRRIGYMAQKFSLYGDLSVRQNLRFFAGAYGLSGQQRRAAMESALATFGLAPYADVNGNAVPLGFQRRLSLACATLHGPTILFLDEPTSGVDPLTRREFWARINALAASGVTVVVTTHFLDEAEYCDRIGVIYRGRLIAVGVPEAMKESLGVPTLEDVFIHLIEGVQG